MNKSTGSKFLALFLILALVLPMLPLPVRAGAMVADRYPVTLSPGLSPAFAPEPPVIEPFLHADLGVQLDVQPYYVHVGDLVTFTLTLRSAGNVPLEGAVVSTTLPAGLSEIQPPPGWDYDPTTRLLGLTLPAMEPTATITAVLFARVTGLALPEGHVILWVAGSGGTMYQPVRTGTMVAVGNPGFELESRAEIRTETGGRLMSADGRVTIDLPPGVLQAPGLLRTAHRPWGLVRQNWPEGRRPNEWAGYYRTLPAFQVLAEDEQGTRVTQFDRPVTFTVQYDPAEVAALGMEEVDLSLFWWDEDYLITYSDGLSTTGGWAVIPSQVDLVHHTVSAAASHFSGFTLSDGSSPSDAYLPSVQAFQVSLLTGASTASYPINVPQGPGGLAPQLSLSYSSSAYDGKAGLRDGQQAGWAGRGWSLGLDYIGVVKNTAGGQNYNTYSLVLNGVSTDLVTHLGEEYGFPMVHYHTADEQFWKIWQESVGPGIHSNDMLPVNDTVWYVQTKDGTLYQFGEAAPDNPMDPNDIGNRAWWAWDASWDCMENHVYGETYRWFLTKVTDKHDNSVEYFYDHYSSLPMQYIRCGHGTYGVWTADTWPTEIRWGSNGNLRFRVRFDSAARSADLVYDGAPLQIWEPPHETRQLNALYVESAVGATTWELVRRYDLGFYEDDDFRLRPDTGTKFPKLTLNSVKMCGVLNGQERCLPSTQFTYQMSGEPFPNDTNGKYRLLTVNNGYGGTVTYTYEKIVHPWVFEHRNRVTTRTVEDELGTAPAVWSYIYGTPQENLQNNSAAVWYTNNVLHETSWLVHQPRLEFRGHDQVTVVDPLGNQVEHWFYMGSVECQLPPTDPPFDYDDPDPCWQSFRNQEALAGKEWKTAWHNNSLSVFYKKSISDYTVEQLPHSMDVRFGLRRNFAYQSQAREIPCAGDETTCTEDKQKRIEYRYDEAYQGGQFGNLTHILEYAELVPGAGEVLVRTTMNKYAPNFFPDWIVGAKVQEAVYEGAESDATWQSQTLYLYDGQAPFYAPNVGELSRVMRYIDYDDDPQVQWATTTDTAYEYDEYGNQTTVTTFNGVGGCNPWKMGGYTPASNDPRTTSTTYDLIFHVYPTAISYPNGTIEQADYDYRMGLVTKYTGVNNEDTYYSYDALGRFWKMWKPGDTEALPTVENAYHDSTNTLPGTPMMWAVWYKGEETAVPWTTGGTWKRQFYNGLGQLIEVQTPHQDYAWDGSPSPATGQDIVTYYQYDGTGQKTAESVPYLVPTYIYDPNCNGSGLVCSPYRSPDEGQPVTTYNYIYGAVQQETLVTYPDGSQSRSEQFKLETTLFDENNNKVKQETDPLGRLIKVREYGNAPLYDPPAETVYNYDVLDQLKKVTNAAGNITTVEYDHLGRKVQMVDPDMGQWSYVYDPLGNMVQQIDARGQSVCFTYDNMNRMHGKDYKSDNSCTSASTQSFIYQYDNELGDANTANSWGKLRRAYIGADPTQNGHEYKYDDRGRTIWDKVWLDGTGYETASTYDPMDRVKTMTYPGSYLYSEILTYAYWPNGAINSVSSNYGPSYVGEIKYNETGSIDEMCLGGVCESKVVDVVYNYYKWQGEIVPTPGESRKRLKSIQASGQSDSLMNLSYADYDLVGNLLEIRDYEAAIPPNYQQQLFTYDERNRLLSAVASNGQYGNYGPETYTYDAIGDLTSKTGMGVYTYQDPAHKHAVTHLDNVQKFWYDANGNQVKRIVGADTYDPLTYDNENHLVAVQKNGVPNFASFVYGPGGERVKGTVDGVTTLYVGGHFEKVLTGLEAGTERKYYYAGSQRIAMRQAFEGYFFLLGDHLGSTTVTASSGNGSEVGEVLYEAWGEDRYDSETVPTTYRYTGQRQEENIGLYYYGARWYDPYIARWIQPDTIVPGAGNPQNMNRYSYSLNGPVRYTDPSGHRPLDEETLSGPAKPPIIPAVEALMRMFVGEGVFGNEALAVEAWVIKNRAMTGFAAENDGSLRTIPGQVESGMVAAVSADYLNGEWMANNYKEYNNLREIAEGVVSGDISNPMTENPDATYFSHSRCEEENVHYEQEINVGGSNDLAPNYGGFVEASSPSGWHVYYYGPAAGKESNPVSDPRICLPE